MFSSHLLDTISLWPFQCRILDKHRILNTQQIDQRKWNDMVYRTRISSKQQTYVASQQKESRANQQRACIGIRIMPCISIFNLDRGSEQKTISPVGYHTLIFNKTFASISNNKLCWIYSTIVIGVRQRTNGGLWFYMFMCVWVDVLWQNLLKLCLYISHYLYMLCIFALCVIKNNLL